EPGEHYADIRLADESFDRPSAISLVLGTDAYAHITKEGIITKQRGLPVAKSTRRASLSCVQSTTPL
ncbi:hypothetical protein KR044_006970, partial [Drosophila immigrans]